jgi:hypothetical protein
MFRKYGTRGIVCVVELHTGDFIDGRAAGVCEGERSVGEQACERQAHRNPLKELQNRHFRHHLQDHPGCALL